MPGAVLDAGTSPRGPDSPAVAQLSVLQTQVPRPRRVPGDGFLSCCRRPCPAAAFGPCPTAQASSMTCVWCGPGRGPGLQPQWGRDAEVHGQQSLGPSRRPCREGGLGRVPTVLAMRLLHVEGKETQRAAGPCRAVGWLPSWRPRTRAGSPPGGLVSIFKAKDVLGRKINELERLCLLGRIDVFN